MCDCADWLKTRSAEFYVLTDRLYRRKSTRGNARVARRKAVAHAWSAGELMRRQREAGQ